MQNHKTWDDYLTESSSAKDTVPLVPLDSQPTTTSNSRPKGTGNPFRNMDAETTTAAAESDRSLTDQALNAGDSDNMQTAGNERDECTEDNRNQAENTLNSLESIDIYPFGGVGGENRARTSRERFLLFEGEDGATSPSPLKDVFNNSDVKGSTRYRDDSDVLKCNKLFGNDMKV